MRIFDKIAIVGTGLIGGSLALAIKQRDLSRQVTGVSRRRSSLRRAEQCGAVDTASQDIGVIRDADLVILALPIEAILKLAPSISRLLKPSALVIDVASTKEKIVSCLDGLFKNFLGCHPLAGSEKKGIFNARADLFKDSLVVITPTRRTKKATLTKIANFWARLGVKGIVLNPRLHDKIVASVSHLPHTVAFSLINSVPAGFLKFAAGGLRDTTRIAASDGRDWADILLSNRKNILTAILCFRKNLDELYLALREKNKTRLVSILNKASKKRLAI